MTLWRVTNHISLGGDGGLRTAGRWHTRGRRVVYCAPNPATALLEILVHAGIDVEDIPVTLRYMEIEAPDSIATETAGVTSPGPAWQTNMEKTRRAGDDWLRSGRTALLRVPSVIVPVTWNILVNPQHPDSAQLRIAHVHEQTIDSRLRR